MMNDKNLEQEQLFFETLSGSEKREYFTMFFISELVFALTKKRKEKRITQAELAKKMGVKQAYVSKVENLEKIPTIETIAKYCYSLNFSLANATEFSAYFARDYSGLKDIDFLSVFLGDTTNINVVKYPQPEYIPAPRKARLQSATR